MWGESSQECEVDCQCSGLITDSFKINSGSNGTKRRRDEALNHNFKFKMNPHSLDFSPLSPIHNSPVITPKRRVFGEIQNINPQMLKSPLIDNVMKQSPITSRSLNSPMKSYNSPMKSFNSPMKSFNSPAKSLNSPLSSLNSPKLNRPFMKRSTTKITRIFEERTKFKSSNKENEIENQFVKFEIEESISFNQLGEPCSSFGNNMESNELKESPVSRELQKSRTIKDWSVMQMDSETPERNFPIQKEETFSPDLEPEMEDYPTLHDLEDFDENFDQCNKYEIISTDSPDIITRGRCDTRKINAKDFSFGAPIGESEPSTSFNKPTAATRMLNFSDFEFTSPLNAKKTQQTTTSVKKSLKFTETPTKTLRHESSCSSIGSMSMSPLSTKLRLFPSESTTSMESGFISEMDEPFLDLDEPSSSPKMANFNELLSGPIKTLESDFVLKRPTLQRSMSYNPEASKARISLFSNSPYKTSPYKKTSKRLEPLDEAVASSSKKRRVFEVPSVNEVGRTQIEVGRTQIEVGRTQIEVGRTQKEVNRTHRPTLQRAYSENAASIMTALARSASDPDLIGDFSQPFALPLMSGNHSDLKSISCDTLAGLMRGEYEDSISDFKVIDCRYPYEFAGGHVTGATNLYTPQQILQFIHNPPTEEKSEGNREEERGRRVLVFHCEYSLERGPKLSRFLRSSDRAKNKENYPSLNYPEVYLLHEGYHAFFSKYPELCSPAGYTMMLDPRYKSELVKFRRTNSSSKSFMM